jgi:transcriptional regulator with XRE-family HTH domain
MNLAKATGPPAPEVMRRQLRATLRRHREDASLTQREVADSLDWSVSKLIRIETGAVGVAPTDVRALLGLYKVADQAHVDELVELARGSRTKSFSQYRDVYSQASLTLFANEDAAQAIYKYEPHFVPGLLQTEEYARTLLIGLGYDESSVERRVTGRLERQELLEKEDRLELHYILGEAAVRHMVGGPRVMANQLAALKYISTHRSGIHLQILPFSAGAHPRMGESFTILEFADPGLDDLIYLETTVSESVSREDPELVADYRRDFVMLQEMACSTEDFSSILEKLGTDMAIPLGDSQKRARSP